MKCRLLTTTILFMVSITIASSVLSEVPTDGLLVYYPFNGNANDESGNNHNASVHGAVLTNDHLNNSEGAYLFDGSDDYISVGVALPSGSASRSISLWFNTTSTSGSNGWYTNTAASWGSPSNNNLCAIAIYKSRLMFGGFGTGNDVYTGINVADGIWHHVVVTYNGSTVKIYLDNSVVASESRTLSTTGNGTFLIGDRVGQNTHNLNGKIDEVYVYNRALANDEIESLYSDGIPRITLNPTDLNFIALENGELPTDQQSIISNAGGGILNWSVATDVPWLSVSPASGTSNSAPISASISSTSLAPGNYNATIVVSSSNANCNQQTISVTYEITSNCRTIGNLQICADSWTTISPDLERASGNVTINNILVFSGDLTINWTTLRITGECSIKLYSIPIVGVVTLWSGPIDFNVQGHILNELVNPALSQIKLAGLKVELSEIALQPDGVALKGELVFLDRGGTKITITNISVTRASGVQVAGSVTYSNNIRFKGLLLKDLNLVYNTIDNEFGGGLTVEIPRMVTIGGQVSILQGDLNEVSMTINVAPGVPIDATGLFLLGGSGSIQHIAEADPENLLISLTANVTGGPTVAGYSIIELNQMGVSIQPITYFAAHGNFNVFSQTVASGTVSYESHSIKSEFRMDLAGVFDARFNTSMTDYRISGGAEGTLQIPELPLWLRWTGLSGQQLGNVRGQFEDAKVWGQIQSREICAWGDIGCFRLSAAYKLVYNGGTNVDFFIGTNYDNLQQVFSRTNSRGQYSEGFNVSTDIPQVWFMVLGDGEAVPGFNLIDPDSTVFDSTNMPYIRNDVEGVALYIVEDPIPGTWQINIPDDGSQTLSVEAYGKNNAPMISLLEPSDSTSSGQIRWIDSDEDDNAIINLYYDTDNIGFDGVPINLIPISEDDSTNYYSWDFSSVAAGSYNIYAVISDYSSAPYAVYAPGVISLAPSGAPSVPTSLNALPTDSSLQLGWDYSTESRLGYLVHYTSDTMSVSYNSAIAVDDTNHCELFGLTWGRYYKLAVSSYDEYGNEGSLSDHVVVMYMNPTGNNPPLITSIDPPDYAQEGQEYSYPLTALDLDHDPIDFIAVLAPTGFSIVSNQVSWVPDTLQISPQLIMILASDNAGGYDTLEFVVIVNDASASYGSVFMDKSRYYSESDNFIIQVIDMDLNNDHKAIDSAQINLSSSSDPEGYDTWIFETSASSGQFSGVGGFSITSTDPVAGDILVHNGDSLHLQYEDMNPSNMLNDNAIWNAGCCIHPIRGNVDNLTGPGGEIDVSDLTFLVAYLFSGGEEPPCLDEGNVDGQDGPGGPIDVSDLTYLVAYLFSGGPVPAECP